MAIQDSYMIITVSFAGGGVDTAYTLGRSTVGPAGPFVILGENLPLLGERSVFVDTTAPLGVPLYYTGFGKETGSAFNVVLGPIEATTSAWLKDPLRPWADIELDFCDTAAGHSSGCTTPDPAFIWGGLGDQKWNDDAGLFTVLDSETPADVWARRKFADGTMRFFTRTLDAIDRVYDLFTAGGPLLLQLPPEYGWHDRFIQPGQVTQEYGSRDQRRPLRSWTVPFTVVDRPLGPAQGTACANWCAVQESFSTFGDMTATGMTWLDLLEGDVLCPPGAVDGFGIGSFGDGPFGDGG